MKNPWSLTRGAQLQSDNSVRFSVWAPRESAPKVRVCDGPAAGDHPLAPSPTERGVFSADVAGVADGAEYVFLLGDGVERPDPVARWQPKGVHGPSAVVDPTAFAWSDDTWPGLRHDELVIYELHVGTFTPEGTFEAVI